MLEKGTRCKPRNLRIVVVTIGQRNQMQTRESQNRCCYNWAEEPDADQGKESVAR